MPEVVIANEMGLTNDDMASIFEEGERKLACGIKTIKLHMRPRKY